MSIRRNHERRAGETPTPETLARQAHHVLATFGVTRGPSWVQRTVRAYLASPVAGMPFGAFLAARVELNAQQCAALRARDELRYLLEYADPTGETAVANVVRGARERR